MQRALGRDRRRQQLLQAAVTVVGTKGLRAASVDDIVRAAGVAKGTFYLYFATKDDLLNALAERLIEGVADHIEAAAADPTLSPERRIGALAEALTQVGRQPFERDLVEIIHRPENRAVHDRLSEHVMARLRPTVCDIIAEGIAVGMFDPQDARRATAFVLGAFTQLHDVVVEPADLHAATVHLHAFILRGLGYTPRL